MIGYICKYAPAEILEAFGETVELMEPKVTGFSQADTHMHANICSFTKSVLEAFEEGGYDGLLLTTCCDSVRRLYDVLKDRHPDKFIYCVDLPHKVNDFAASLYEKEMEKLCRAYCEFSGKSFSEDEFLAVCRRKAEAAKLRTEPEAPADLRVGLIGARPGSAIKNLIRNHHVRLVFDLTCTGTVRAYDLEQSAILNSYAAALLNQMPCLRMARGTNRERFLEQMADEVDGLICHTVKFCDIYSYEYSRLHVPGGLPILKIETDATLQCEGQILTRLEAFLESLRARKRSSAAGASPVKGAGADSGDPDFSQSASAGRNDFGKDTPMYVLGIDSGSTSTNAVILDEQKNILATAVLRTGAKSGESADHIMDLVLERAGLRREQLTQVISTGYGRVSIGFADRDITEISCHGKGAHFLDPSIRTILDIGGQDSKAIRLDEQGNVIDFVMNDKCAAGTGRFLEMMARTLEVSIEELGPISLQSKEHIQISSMCSVFAESEVISLIAQNKETADIAHGVHEAIVNRALSLIRRVGSEPAYMMTGGVAKNPGVAAILEEKLGCPVIIPPEPEIVGALGAALFALEGLA